MFFLHNSDFFIRQAVKLVNELVDLLVRRVNLTLNELFVPGRIRTRKQRKRIQCRKPDLLNLVKFGAVAFWAGRQCVAVIIKRYSSPAFAAFVRSFSGLFTSSWHNRFLFRARPCIVSLLHGLGGGHKQPNGN